MTIFIPGNTAVENTRTLAQSALPDAPVIADEPQAGAEVRGRVGAVLRSAARRTLRLADRIDPLFEPETS